MTQANAIDTNYQNLNTALMQEVSAPVETVQPVRPEKFVKALDKLVNTSEHSMTIGDIKAAAKADTSNDVMSVFSQVFADNVQEMGLDKSFDLTLARSEKENEADSNDFVRDLINLAADIVIPQAAPVVEEAVNKGAEVVNKVLNANLIMEGTKVSEQEIEDAATKVIADDSAKEDAVSEGSDFELDEDIVKKLNIEVVKAEADTSGNDGFSQEQRAEEYGIKAMIQQTAEASNVNFENIQTQLTQVKPTEISPEKIIEQITKQLQFKINSSKVDIVLNPESLGKVNLKLINTNDGLTAQFTVTTQDAKDLIMKGLDILRSNLLAHGVNLDSISVKVSETEKESYNQDWTEQEGSRGGNKEERQFTGREKEEGLFEKTIAKVFKENEESI